MQKIVYWQGIETKSEERCVIDITAAGIEIRSIVYGEDQQGATFEYAYTMELSPEWQLQHIIVTDAKEEGDGIDLQRENGQWFDASGRHLEAFDGVSLVDFALTPLTNTLAMKQLQDGPSPQDIQVLYLDAASLELSKVRQRYTRLGKHTYRFQDVSRGFSAELVTDDDDLILIYPGLFMQKSSNTLL